MRKVLLALALVCVVGGVWWFARHKSALRAPILTESSPAAAASPSGRPSISNATSASALAQPLPVTNGSLPSRSSSPALTPEVIAAFAVSNAALPAVPSDIVPATVLENMRTTIRQYGAMFFGNPVGTNPEITRALNGENPKQVKFINPELGLRINAQGELVDSWGTPFFFHQLSSTETEIRSAGPDRELWSADDLVIK